MLLQSILAQLDDELSRLHKLRDVVAGLRRPAPQKANLAPTPVVETATASEPTPPQSELPAENPRPHRRVRMPSLKPRSARLSPAAKHERLVEPTALTNAIPAGPVIVSAKDLARERDVRAKSRLAIVSAPVADEQVLDTLTRDIAARWASGRNRANA